MKKQICFVITVMLACSITARSQTTYLINSSGSYITSDSGTIVLNNASLANSGSVAVNSKVFFTGSQPATAGGSGSSSLKNIVVDKTGSVLLMTGDVQAGGTIRFADGLLDVNTHVVNLGTTGSLSGENDASRVTGTNGGFVSANTTAVDFPTGENIGNLGAVLSSSQSLGSVTISRYHKPFENPGNNTLTGIQRSYFIQPANNSSLNATLRFYYLDAELNGKDENTLGLWQSSDGVNWTNIGADGRNTTANFVEKAGISSLSWFTLTDASNALPVRLISFKAICQNNYTLLQWQTASEVNASSFIIEKSSDGISWAALQTVAATNTLSGALYSYKDVSPQATSYYRIKMTDKNGNASSCSPVFSGGCSEITRPVIVYPNPAHTSATVSFAVRQNGDAVIQLYSLSGQTLYSRKLAVSIGTNNIVIPVANLAAGTYSVKLFVNGQTLESRLAKD